MTLHRRSAFVLVLGCLLAALAFVGSQVQGVPRARRTRTPLAPSRLLADSYIKVLCRLPDDAETLRWDSRPIDRAVLEPTLANREEAERVRRIRPLYYEVLRRDATLEDCGRIRGWVDRKTNLDTVQRDLVSQPEGRRVAQVRQAFVDTLGRDPWEWDVPALRRWVNSVYTVPEIRSRLAAQRPLVGIHYFMWYERSNPWGNGATRLADDAPRPIIGPYDSSDTVVISSHIKQIEEAGFDFALVHVVINAPKTWMNAHIFMDQLSRHHLSAAILIDGLYNEEPEARAVWVQKVKDEFTGNNHYLRLYGQPLIVIFSAELKFNVPGVIMRNMYWTSRYTPGNNSFNPNKRLDARDWAFWSPTPPPLTNGLVPVIPGYNDAPLGRPQTMVHPRENGRYYGEQWQRAIALHPELIIVYGWNEYFEQTAIEPTNVWGYRYLELSACYIAHAHRRTTGNCP